MCGQCKYAGTCSLRNRLDKCPNFVSILVDCTTCIFSGKCVKEQFFTWCENYRLNPKKVVKNG